MSRSAHRVSSPQLRIADLVATYGFTPRYWTRMAASGKVPSAQKTDGQWSFDFDEIQRWWESCKKQYDPLPEISRFLGVSLERAQTLMDRGLLTSPAGFYEIGNWQARFSEQTRPISFIGNIYFIEWPPGFIKIGFAKSVAKRLATLQAGAPVHLSLIHSVKGTIAREGEILEAFNYLRVRGEWFRDHPDIRQFVEKLKKYGDRRLAPIQWVANP